MAATLKSMVSKKKCRHKEGKFDLDLTYISPRIIAMGYPAEKVESIYRNDYHTVKEFLDKKHENHYWVYNLCSEKERIYDKKKFDGRVTCYPFDDHHPPVYSLIQPFCDDVKKYLDADERNVAVVHCKAGKGRTGVMICCFLLYINPSYNAESVLRFYGDKRTTDQKGVTIPSQRRYITYYDAMNRRGLEYKPVKLYLKDIVLDPMPNCSNGQSYVSFEVTQRGRREPYISKQFLFRKNDRNVSLSVNPPLLLSEDVKFEFITKPKFGENINIFGNNLKMQKLAKTDRVFHFWLNTFFVDMELEGGLAHDLTGANPISSSEGQRNHVHHASGSSEDSSTDDVPLKQASNGLSVTFREASKEDVNMAHRQTSVPVQGNGVASGDHSMEVSNLIKHASISDEHLLQERKNRQTEYPCNSHTTMGPALSTSDENTADTSDSSSLSTTKLSFIQNRERHVSMPQPRVSTCHNHHHLQHQQQQQQQQQSQPHPQLESSLSYEPGSASAASSGGVGKPQHHFFSRHHATITSNSAASLEMAASSSASQLEVPIKGKLLSLRLKKGQIDKAHKDKTCRFPENFSVTLFLVKPDDQSEKLLDYSLYSPALLMATNESASAQTITPVCSSDKFTVESVIHPVSSGPEQRPVRQRPLTGGSGASSSSATPSLKSVEQSSQDSVASSEGEDNNDDSIHLRSCLLKSSSSSSSKKPPSSMLQQPPQSTAI